MTEERELLGALIGLARATDGNTHPTESTWRIMREGLAAAGGGLPAEKSGELTERVREEKRKLVPRCSVCASPCGRNRDHDLTELLREPPELRSLKALLLFGVMGLARRGPSAPGAGEADAGRFFARVLFALGEELDREDLMPLVLETGERCLGSLSLPERDPEA